MSSVCNISKYICDKTDDNFILVGSMDSEAGVFAMTFDQSGSRLITCDADKTIKIYKEDDTAVSVFFISC